MEITVKTDNKVLFNSLLKVIKGMGLDFKTKEIESKPQPSNEKYKYPLAGSILKYDDPFGPACDIDDWEVLK